MTNIFLFPSRVRTLGLILLIVGTAMGVYFMVTDEPLDFLEFGVPAIISGAFMEDTKFFSMSTNNLTDEFIAVLIIVGGLFLGFSKEKVEDELSTRLRLDALMWAVYLNYAVLIIMILFVYGGSFLEVMLYNLFTIIYFFNFRYFYLRAKVLK